MSLKYSKQEGLLFSWESEMTTSIYPPLFSWESEMTTSIYPPLFSWDLRLSRLYIHLYSRGSLRWSCVSTLYPPISTLYKIQGLDDQNLLQSKPMYEWSTLAKEIKFTTTSALKYVIIIRTLTLVYPRHMRLKPGIPTSHQSYWNVFLPGSAGGGWDIIDLRQFYSLLICNGTL